MTGWNRNELKGRWLAVVTWSFFPFSWNLGRLCHYLGMVIHGGRGAEDGTAELSIDNVRSVN